MVAGGECGEAERTDEFLPFMCAKHLLAVHKHKSMVTTRALGVGSAVRSMLEYAGVC